ncbi:hypothetical protein [Flavobacterium sp. HTF]|uniref:hypothetical protein n=1 Tax=Flavobacterium sp. HTF TaxID=2170732 RepID=UPI000D5C50C9|nr:hypothetical protein [Flavobacterium sp. HTF]PWB25439.1 hypothetical protein DCO46_08765 [Flavobacterium sp. HTF]
MSKISNVENGAVYEGYDSLAASEWCTPSFLGCSACISASAVKGQVTITIGLKTPFGSVSKSFSFNTNTSFTWQPFSKFKITVSITNFNEAGGVFSFDLGLNPCIDVPFLGWKCFNYSHTFTVPLLLAGIQSDIDDSQFVSLLTLHASGSLNAPCQCDDHSGSSLLKGDIYSNYLNNQAAIPTLPISQCIPTVSCTGISPICSPQETGKPVTILPTMPWQCLIPTVTLCTTIPAICLSQQAPEAASAGIPTLPISQCIPTASCTGISPICSQQHSVGANAAAIPTLPISQCIPTASCTGIPFICSAAQVNTGYLNAGPPHSVVCWPTVPMACKPGVATDSAAIPTLPISQCIPTASCTGIPFICAAQQQANTAAIPTLPISQCIPTVSCTGISPICLQQQQQANTAAIPTLPISQCIPTVSCTGISPICLQQQQQANTAAIPTLPISQCIPTVSCTGISPICLQQQQQANTAAIPTLPISQCIPTVSCTGISPICLQQQQQANTAAIPTLPISQCVPTVSCTGIPFIC